MARQGKSPLANDLLTGAAQIANYTGYPQRKIYYLAGKKLLPIFWMGSSMNARKSELDAALRAVKAEA